MVEKVNHPEHYDSGVYEVINIIEHYKLGFHLGNVLKYILRADKKYDTPKEDIEKAIWYLNRYLETLEKEMSNEEDKELHLPKKGYITITTVNGDKFTMSEEDYKHFFSGYSGGFFNRSF